MHRSMVQLRKAMLSKDAAVPGFRQHPSHVNVGVSVGKPLGVGTGHRLDAVVVGGVVVAERPTSTGVLSV